MITLLNQAASLKIFHFLDIQLAIRLVENKNPLLLLIFALLSAKTRAGDVCLFIDKLQPVYLFEGSSRQTNEIVSDLWEMAGAPDSNKIYTELKQSNAVCEARQLTTKPLVLSGNKLYFRRMWDDEGLVANFFSQHLLECIDEQQLTAILACFFTSSKDMQQKEDWQKIAVAVAATSRISIISGGPGTGKTTTIARLLVTLIKLSHKKLIIQLAAPTGKAAVKLIESLRNELLKLNLSTDEQEIIPEQAQTIHRLLGAQPNTKLLRYHKSNPLLLDLLIIDEASMIDLQMMARLVEAIPNHARLILLGDQNQLASVEAGAVLADLCRFSECGYSSERAAQLTKITNCDLSNFISDNGPKIKDRICFLRKNYRFDDQSGIAQLATAINQADIKYVEQLLIHSSSTNIIFNSISSLDGYGKLLSDVVRHYRSYLDKIKTGSDYEEILITFNRYRLLAAFRDGLYGVIGLNNKLEQLLYCRVDMQYPSYNWNKNYEGRPIIITKNDPLLGLFNGDIGIMLRDGQYGLKAYFQLPSGVIKKIQPSRLPQHQTAFVMTVHKSQGLEFEHTALVLPPFFTPIVNKELIYTAITRAKNQLTIYADRYIFIKALLTSVERGSGLAERLM